MSADESTKRRLELIQSITMDLTELKMLLDPVWQMKSAAALNKASDSFLEALAEFDVDHYHELVENKPPIRLGDFKTTVKWNGAWGEFRVNLLEGRRVVSSYYTPDREDAEDTARDMLRRAQEGAHDEKKG
jgi:hypothetical protein